MENIHDLLLRLRNVILTERRHAKDLDLPAMQQDRMEKEVLLNALATIDHLPPEEEAIAREIDRENRRNAYLFKATLNWIQETMTFFGHKTIPTTYGQTGSTMSKTVQGRLLSGHI